MAYRIDIWTLKFIPGKCSYNKLNTHRLDDYQTHIAGAITDIHLSLIASPTPAFNGSKM